MKKGGDIVVMTLLTAAFVGLKLAGIIGWSWWLVLMPAWIEAAICAVILMLAAQK